MMICGLTCYHLPAMEVGHTGTSSPTVMPLNHEMEHPCPIHQIQQMTALHPRTDLFYRLLQEPVSIVLAFQALAVHLQHVDAGMSSRQTGMRL